MFDKKELFLGEISEIRTKVQQTVAICIIIVFSTIMLAGCGVVSVFNQTDSEIEPAMLMFVGSKEDINSGELYVQEIGEEKDKLASTAIKDEYILAPNTHAVLLLNKENELYFKAPGVEKTKIASDVLKASYCFSKDESTIAFLVKSRTKEKPTSDLYIQKIGQDKEKITSGLAGDASTLSYKLSADASNIIFLDTEKNLYYWQTATDKEKLANDVKLFNTYDNNNAYSYLNNDDVYYVKFSNDTEAQRISITDIGNLRILDNGLMAVFTGGYNWEKGYGELYSAVKGGDAVKIASNVKSFTIAKDNNLYYVNDESGLYLKQLPEINENTYKDSSKFIDKMNDGEKVKIGSDVIYYEISPNGKNCAYIDVDSNLYLSYNEGEKAKVASDITNVRVYNDRLLFVNKESQLYLNSAIKKTDNIKDNNKVIAQMLNNFSVLNEGKHIMFTTSETNALTMVVDSGEPQEIINECNSYDIILVQNQKAFEKKLLLADIVGTYKNNDLGVAYKITSDRKFTLYEKGEEKETSDLKANGINKLSAELKSDNKDSILTKQNVVFSVAADGTKSIIIDETSYALEVIDEEGLTTELERQKKAEEDAKAEAERKAAAEKAEADRQVRRTSAESRALDYYYDDVYVSSYETLYYSPSYGSASGTTFTDSHWATVYDYEVSYDGYTIWLKVDSDSGFWWVAR